MFHGFVFSSYTNARLYTTSNPGCMFAFRSPSAPYAPSPVGSRMIDSAHGDSNAQSEATIRGTTESVPSPAPRQSRDVFQRPWVIISLIFLAGFIVFFPTLRSPFLLDDYLHAAMVDGTFPCKRGVFDLYDFVNDADRKVLTERGMITWWADPHLQIRFFRPLASALRWGEHLVFGRNSFLLHFHSLCWWFVSVLGARTLFKRALSARAALFATFIYALAPCHVMPLAWLANREVFMSLAFGTFALNAYVQFRDSRAWSQASLAVLLFSLSLLSGEYALCFAGFVLAAEVGRKQESVLRRFTGLGIFAVPATAYMLVRARLGYGSRGSGYYTDPLNDPWRYITVAPRRFVTLLSNEWMSLDYDSFDATTSTWMLVALTLVGAPMILITLRRLYRDLDADNRRWFWTFGLGSLLALPPVMSVSPTPRVLGASMLGVAPLVAMILERAWFVAEQTPRDKSAGAQVAGLTTILLAFAHLVHAPGASWLSAGRLHDHAYEFVDHAASLRARMTIPEHPEIIVVRAVINSFYMPFVLDPTGQLPVHWRILAQTPHALVLRRGPRTLDIIVRPEDRIYSSGPDHLFRADHEGFKVGDVAHMPGVKITILALGSVGPRIVRYEFDRDLESPTLTWLAENNDGFTVEKPLAIGFGKPYDL